MSSLTDMYNIRHICILPYNSQANGVVEQCHLDVQEAIIKSTLGGGILLAYRRSLSLLGQVRDCALVHRFVSILYGSRRQAIHFLLISPKQHFPFFPQIPNPSPHLD